VATVTVATVTVAIVATVRRVARVKT
jgi:hypothetical protein